jgi:hypothetical protein
VQFKQIEADASGAPTGIEPAQPQARLLHQGASGAQGASAAVEARRKIVISRQRLPAGEQITNGADRQSQLLGDVQGGKASLVQVFDLLTQWQGGSGRHARDLRG